jgi:hypothetical protein
MAKVVYGSLKGSKSGRSGSVTTKRIKSSGGTAVTVRKVDADSLTLGEDLRYVFEKNVSKVRRENKQLFGSPDRVSKKG